MIFVADISAFLISFLGLQQKQIKIYRSKGLLAHLLNASITKQQNIWTLFLKS